MFKLLEAANGALKHHQSKLENIDGFFDFNHILLVDGAFHKVLLSGVKLEDTIIVKYVLWLCRKLDVIYAVGTYIQQMVIYSHAYFYLTFVGYHDL